MSLRRAQPAARQPESRVSFGGLDLSAKAGNVSKKKQAIRDDRAAERARPLALLALTNGGTLEFNVELPAMQNEQVLRVIAEMSSRLEESRTEVLTDHVFTLGREGHEFPRPVEFEETDSVDERLERLNGYFPLTVHAEHPDPHAARAKFFYVQFDRDEVERRAPGQPHGGRLMDTTYLYFPVFARATLDALSAALQTVTGANSRTEGVVENTVFPTIRIYSGALMPVDRSVIRLFRA